MSFCFRRFIHLSLTAVSFPSVAVTKSYHPSFPLQRPVTPVQVVLGLFHVQQRVL